MSIIGVITGTIKVVVVDDSIMIRTILTSELNKTDDIKVVAAVADPIQARPLILEHRPDVVTLNVEMPRMDGITFLGQLQQFYPVPVVILSALTAKGSRLAIKALQLGAAEVMEKPGKSPLLLSKKIDQLARCIRAAAISKPRKIMARSGLKALGAVGGGMDKLLIAMAASTGGVEALRYVMGRMPAASPPIAIVQHMPRKFTAAFADSLDQACQIQVFEAADGMEIRHGEGVVAQGGQHLRVSRGNGGYLVHSRAGRRVCHQCPSADVLFESVARAAGSDAVGVILTGMGQDGAAGLLKMRQAGAATIAQDQSSSVVFGMPKEAAARGAAQVVCSLENLSQVINKALKSKAY